MHHIQQCDGCGIRYRDMRTGLTFATVRREMFTSDPDPSSWRHKRRHSVLGFWHELKLKIWHYHLGQCGQSE